MPKGLPSTRSKEGPQPLGINRLEDVPLTKVGIFRATRQREDRKTKEKYEVDVVLLSLDFDSGHMQHDGHGQVIVDDDSGEPKPHYINVGYVTLTGSAKGNLPDILKALGFSGPDFIEQDGDNAGGLRDDLDIQMTFGINELGHDYSDSEYDDLPLYDWNDRDGPRKRQVEVPVLSWTINGYPVIGRKCDMALEVKNGYDKPTAFLAPRNPEPLRTIEEEADEAFSPATQKAAPKAKGPDEPEPTGKGQKYVWDLMEDLNVPVENRTPIMRKFTADPSIKNIASMNIEYCRNLRDAEKQDPSLIKTLNDQVMNGDGDDFDDDAEEF